MNLFDFFTNILGIEAGSEYLRIIKDGELIFNEPSKISFDISNTSNIPVSGIGNLIKSSSKDKCFNPITYVINDFTPFELLLRAAINKGLNIHSVISKGHIMYFCIPTNATEVDKRAYRDVGEHSGAKQVYMILQSYCSAIGMNLLSEKKGNVN